jgi:hypothetical protein
MLRRILRPQKDEITAELRKRQNVELNDLYCSPNIMRLIKYRRMRWSGRVLVPRMRESRGIYKVLVGKPRKEATLRPIRRWEDNLKMDLQEVGWGDMDWIHVALDRDRWRALVRAVMNLRVP